jgi:predicted TIM-barrel fold metal-dependent hydrolase
VVGVRAPCAPATDSRVAEAMAMLAKHHLHFELAKPSDQLDEAVALAMAFPRVTFILNHCGEGAGPAAFADRPAAQAQWQANIRALGALPNVVAKVGGVHDDVQRLGG